MSDILFALFALLFLFVICIWALMSIIERVVMRVFRRMFGRSQS